MSVRAYVPATPDLLADYLAAQAVPVDADPITAEDESEEAEYAALMTAADLSAARIVGLADGLRRRVVVVLEQGGTRILAVHADPVDDADADDDLAWYASQELDSLLSGIV